MVERTLACHAGDPFGHRERDDYAVAPRAAFRAYPSVAVIEHTRVHRRPDLSEIERFEAPRDRRPNSFGADTKVEKRRIECSNPAWGTAQLEDQLSELLLAHERAKAERR